MHNSTSHIQLISEVIVYHWKQIEYQFDDGRSVLLVGWTNWPVISEYVCFRYIAIEITKWTLSFSSGDGCYADLWDMWSTRLVTGKHNVPSVNDHTGHTLFFLLIDLLISRIKFTNFRTSYSEVFIIQKLSAW